MWLIIIVGIVLLVFAYIKNKEYLNSVKVVEHLKFLPLLPVKELKELMVNRADAESFNQVVDFCGTIDPNSVIAGEYSGSNCIYYEIKETELYEQSYYKDKGNYSVRKSRKGTRIVNHSECYCKFSLLDKDGGCIIVEPSDYKYTNLETTYSHYEPYDGNSGRDYQVLGHTIEEKAFLADKPLYVAGSIKLENDELIISRPEDKQSPFIISNKTKDENIVDLTKKSRTIRFLSIFFLITGCIGVLAGIVLTILQLLGIIQLKQ